MEQKIGIIGSGNVGSALQRGLSKAGCDVQVSRRDNVAEVAAEADIVILAVPFGAIDDVVRKLGDTVDDKIVVDVTNALTKEGSLAIGFTTSGAEELQRKLPHARVVKAFNTVFAQHMDTGTVGGERLTMFAASDDDDARKTVLSLARSIGFDAVSAGPLENARQLEDLGFFNIKLGYGLGNGQNVGFKYVHQ